MDTTLLSFKRKTLDAFKRMIGLTQLGYPDIFSLNSLNLVTKIFVITVKGFEPVLETRILPQYHHDICMREDL